MNFYCKILCVIFLCLSSVCRSQVTGKPAFMVIPLGVKGGIDESNLSAYLLSVDGTNEYICLDAGTLNYGIQKAVDARLFSDTPSNVLKKNVKAYLISHPHLDHVAGLVMNSPDDSPKSIYGLPHCIDVLKEKYFTWESWANFGDDGEKPLLKKYHYNVLTAGKEVPVENTGFSVQAFVLSHGNPYQSTAFLVRHDENYFLYLGDTGADSLEKSNNLQLLWNAVGPLIRAKKLKAIFMEVSYPDEQPYNQLFGHLTPALLMKEMDVLAKVAGDAAMKGLPVAITHMKPSGAHEEAIKKQLRQRNKLQLKLVFPEQAKALRF